MAHPRGGGGKMEIRWYRWRRDRCDRSSPQPAQYELLPSSPTLLLQVFPYVHWACQETQGALSIPPPQNTQTHTPAQQQSRPPARQASPFREEGQGASAQTRRGSPAPSTCCADHVPDSTRTPAKCARHNTTSSPHLGAPQPLPL